MKKAQLKQGESQLRKFRSGLAEAGAGIGYDGRVEIDDVRVFESPGGGSVIRFCHCSIKAEDPLDGGGAGHPPACIRVQDQLLGELHQKLNDSPEREISVNLDVMIKVEKDTLWIRSPAPESVHTEQEATEQPQEQYSSPEANHRNGETVPA